MKTGVLLTFLIGLILIMFIGASALESIAARSDAALNPAPGRLVEVGGHRLHLTCTGEGSPVVVLDAGLGDSSAVWQAVQEGVAAFGRACTYDRAGYGWSDPAPGPRSFQRAAEELHALLKNGGEAGPFVLVGHSAGANTARFFAAAYPQEVAGLVLVEPPLLTEAQPVLVAGLKAMRMALKILSRIGVIRWLGDYSKMGLLFGGASPPAEVERRAGFLYRPAAIQASIAEIEALPETVAALNRSNSPGAWGDWPVLILAARKGKEVPQAVAQALGELAGLSTNGRVEWVEGSHFVHFEYPEMVVDAIHQVTAHYSGR